MKFKALRTITEPKEFVHIDTIDGTMLMYTCDLPRPQPLTATLENMREYYINNVNISMEVNHGMGKIPLGKTATLL